MTDKIFNATIKTEETFKKINNMNESQNKKNAIIDWKCALAAMVVIFIIGGAILTYLWNKKEEKVIVSPTNSPTPTVSVSPSPTPSLTPIITPVAITYTTFSSAKANFTFEYPSTWVYDEKIDPNDAKSTDWDFYSNSDKNYETLILGIVSPLSEVVDFCSGGPQTAKGDTYGFTISIFPTNDPKTYVTYEQCGDQNGYGYVYWQKGEYFANSSEIKNIYKISLMKFYSSSENGKKIAEHIVKSIKIK